MPARDPWEQMHAELAARITRALAEAARVDPAGDTGAAPSVGHRSATRAAGTPMAPALYCKACAEIEFPVLWTPMNKWVSGEWVVDRTNARQRRTLHYWLTIIWLTAGTAIWLMLSDVLWFVGFMSLYAIWISHLAGWAAETPVETEMQEPQD